jgi:hypothetical protein
MDFIKVLAAFVGSIIGGNNRGRKTQVELGLDTQKQCLGLWGVFTLLMLALVAFCKMWVGRMTDQGSNGGGKNNYHKNNGKNPNYPKRH